MAPTLIVWDEHDAIVPPAIGRRVAALVPGARRVVLPGADHTSMGRQPDAFAAAVVAFLADSTADGAG